MANQYPSLAGYRSTNAAGTEILGAVGRVSPTSLAPSGIGAPAVATPSGAETLDGSYLTLTAGQDLSGHRIVWIEDGTYADTAQLSRANHGIALTTNSALSGQSVRTLVAGVLFESSWSWDVSGGVIYLGPSGTLTQTPTASGLYWPLAVALASNKIYFNPDLPTVII